MTSLFRKVCVPSAPLLPVELYLPFLPSLVLSKSLRPSSLTSLFTGSKYEAEGKMSHTLRRASGKRQMRLPLSFVPAGPLCPEISLHYPQSLQ